MKLIFSGVVCIFQFFAFVAAESNGSTNKVKHASSRIMGGERARIEDYPYLVSLRRPNPYNSGKLDHFCGGSIVTELHIVTAAHCVEKKLAPEVMKNIKVVSGTSRSDVDSHVHAIKSITMHPKYRGAAGSYFDDIAVVTLSDPIKFGPTEYRLLLPTSDIKDGAKAIVTGWGYTSNPNGRTPIYMEKASMTLIDSDKCGKNMSITLRNTQVCGYNSGRGTGVCYGDSGTPLVVNGQLVGVASFVIECGAGYPDVYTNVYPYVSFILGFFKDFADVKTFKLFGNM